MKFFTKYVHLINGIFSGSNAHTFLLALLLLFICFKSQATTWTTSATGAINTLANWTDGTTSPTTFATPGDTWNITENMFLPNGATWTVGTVSSPPALLLLTSGGTLSLTGGIVNGTVTVYGNIDISGGAFSFDATEGKENVNIYGDFTLDSGTFSSYCTTDTQNINISGDFILNNGTFSQDGNTSVNFIDIGGSLTLNNGTFLRGGTWPTCNMDIHGDFTLNNGTFSQSATDGIDSIIVHGNLILAGGTFFQSGNTTVKTVNVYGSLTMGGTTISLNGTIPTLTVNVTGNATMSGGAVTATGNSPTMNMNVTGNYTMTSGYYDMSGTGPTLNMNITGNYTMASGYYTLSGTGPTVNINVYSNYKMTSGFYNLSGTYALLLMKVYGNCSISGPSYMENASGGSNTIHLALPSSTGTMLLDNTSTGTWVGQNNFYVDTNCIAQLDSNFEIPLGPVSYNGLTVNGTLICPAADTVKGGGRFLLNGIGTLVVAHSTGINGAIINTGIKIFKNSANYGFNGSVPQVTGSYLPDSLVAPDSITINNTTGVTLTQSTKTTGKLIFIGGILYTDTGTMSVPGVAASVVGAGAAGYVAGTLIKTISGLSSVNYEVGDTDYAPVALTLDNPGTSGSFGVMASHGLHPNVGTSGISPLYMTKHYWTITNLSAAGPDTVLLKATYNLPDILGGSNSYFVTQEYSGTAWLSSPLASLNTTAPYTTAPITGIPVASLAGDYIFGRIGGGPLNSNSVANSSLSELKVFPNPNEGSFTICIYSNTDEQVHIVITNVVGEKVKELTTTTNKPASVKLDQSAGVYLLSAFDGHSEYFAKIVIE